MGFWVIITDAVDYKLSSVFSKRYLVIYICAIGFPNGLVGGFTTDPPHAYNPR